MAPNLEQLFRLYHRELQQLAYRRLGDREAAADLAQDTFLRYAGLDHGSRREAIANPRFFLLRILGNLIIDLRRSRGRRSETTPLDELDDHLLDARPGPERLYELRQQLQLLHQALQELPPNCREALLLNRLHGLNHAAIAERLGVSPSMVCKYIMRALRHCARRLGLVAE
ncbi:RNA polymerase sigma factor [Pseudomonas paralcaligenes]|uniref:RNA polymerase sigma factor n=1 Tax=Pseudomonas paralcaligenes TaxID=2772558 RepID=UPI001C7F278B|nr:RNA polymerase sigma factor [Pseudomonas paralcaligenes]